MSQFTSPSALEPFVVDSYQVELHVERVLRTSLATLRQSASEDPTRMRGHFGHGNACFVSLVTILLDRHRA